MTKERLPFSEYRPALPARTTQVRPADFVPGWTESEEVSVPPLDTPSAEEPAVAVAEAEPVPQEAAQPAMPRAGDQAAPPERQRITVAGRVGQPPRFRTTPRGQLVAQFPLGVHPDPDTTRWYPILVFGARAAKLRDETPLAAGDQVTVIGYVHHRSAAGKGGQRREIAEIYAVAIRT